MADFETQLTITLKTDKRFLDQDGELLRNNVIDAAHKADRGLIELLLESQEAKKKFFSDIKSHWVFDINGFVTYIQDKHFLNDSYTKYKNKIGLNVGGKFMGERGEVSLVWPFKDTVLEGGMTKEDENRKEIFFNEILANDEIDKLFAPKVLTNWKRYTKTGEEKVSSLGRNEQNIIKENLIIKGNNLLALHTLKQQFSGQVKLIYIDPPYNTGSDSFGYNDNFNHSTWLTFMKNRLEVATKLLREDGVIFVAIDDHEIGYLRILMDDIFGQTNFVQNFLWLHGKGKKDKNSRTLQQYNVCYAKNKEALEPWSEIAKINYSNVSNPDNDSRGDWFSGSVSFSEDRSNKNHDNYFEIKSPSGVKWQRQWQCSREEMNEYLKDNRIYFGPKPECSSVPRLKIFPGQENEIIPNNIFDDVGTTKSAQNELDLIIGKSKSFDNPKPEKLLLKIIEMATDDGDLVLDFFAGSGTTLAVAHKIGRQYIGVEQMHYIHDLPEFRIKKVVTGEQGGVSKEVNWKGGGDFIYCELLAYNQAFIDDIQDAKDTKGLLKIWKRMKEEAFFKFNIDMLRFEEGLSEFELTPLGKQKQVLCEMLDKNQLYVNFSEINDTDFKTTKEDKGLCSQFYGK